MDHLYDILRTDQVYAVSGSTFGSGSGIIILQDVGCGGSESNIAECNHLGWGVITHCVGATSAAGVVCTGNIVISYVLNTSLESYKPFLLL